MSTRRLLQQNNNSRSGVPYQLATPGNTAPLGAATFSRADATTCAQQLSATLVWAAVAANVLRDSHWVDGTRTILLESLRKQLAVQSENIFAGWTQSGTPSGVTGSDTSCGIVLDTLSDDSGAQLQGFFETIAFTGDGTKCLQIVARQSTSTSTAVRIRDTTLGTKLLGVITWDGSGVPSMTMTTGTLLGKRQLTAGIWIFYCVAPSIVAANSNQFQMWPATDAALSAGGTGAVIAGGAMAEDAAFPTSYIRAAGATVTRAVDALSLVGVNLVGTLFYHYFDLATFAWNDAVAAYAGNVAIVPPVDRAYSHIAVVQGTRTAAQCKAILGGYFP